MNQNKSKELASRFHEGTGKKHQTAQRRFFDWFFDSFHNRPGRGGDAGGYKSNPN